MVQSSLASIKMDFRSVFFFFFKLEYSLLGECFSKEQIVSLSNATERSEKGTCLPDLAIWRVIGNHESRFSGVTVQIQIDIK